MPTEVDAPNSELWDYAHQWQYPIDMGIVRAVKVLRDAGIHTTESCEGGEGHAYPEPTVKFCGGPSEGWKALSELMTFGLPVEWIGQCWTMTYGVPDGPRWYVTFKRKLPA
jgi:hypothetical protein